MQLFVGVAAHLEAEVLDGGLRDLLHVLDHLLVPLRLRGAEGGSRRELMCCGGVNTSRGGVGKCAGREAERGPRMRTSIRINRVDPSGISSTDGCVTMVSDSSVS